MLLGRVARSLLSVCFIVLLGTLVACGGGKKSQGEPVINSSVTLLDTQFQSPSLFKITGSNLNSVYVSVYDPLEEGLCTDFSEIARTSNSIVVKCTPQRPSVRFDIYTNAELFVSSLTAKVTEPEIKFLAVIPDSNVRIGAESQFTISGENLNGYLIFLPEASGCVDLQFVSIQSDNTAVIVKCRPVSRQPSFTVTAQTNSRLIGTIQADLQSAPVGPAVPVEAFADISTLLNESNTFTMDGYFFGPTKPQITSDSCDSISVNNSLSNTFKLVWTCTPTAMSVDFQVKDLDNPGDNDTTTLTAKLPSRVNMVTSLGNIVIAVDSQRAPITVANFLQYVTDNYYNDTLFHRITTSAVDQFSIVQGGAFTSQEDLGRNVVKAGQRDAISLEPTLNTGLSNTVGTIAMARTSSPNSATSQIFFNVSDNSANFDYVSNSSPGYAVFGSVIGQSSLDTINAINAVPTTSQVPNADVKIISVTQTQ